MKGKNIWHEKPGAICFLSGTGSGEGMKAGESWRNRVPSPYILLYKESISQVKA